MNNQLTKKPKRRGAFILPILVFTTFVFSTAFVPIAFAGESIPGCGLFEIKQDCDLSGWMKLLLGDIAVGAVLAIFLHILAHRSNLKIEHNARAIQNIVSMQEVQRNRRKDFAVFNLKNLFNILLHVIGQVNKSTFNFNDIMERETNREKREWTRSLMLREIKGEEERVARIINSIRNNLLAANDVMEPDVVNQIEGICTYLSEIYAIETLDGVMTLPKYQISKKKIRYMLEKLGTYTVEDHLFKEIKNNTNDIYENESQTRSKNSRFILKGMKN